MYPDVFAGHTACLTCAKKRFIDSELTARATRRPSGPAPPRSPPPPSTARTARECGGGSGCLCARLAAPLLDESPGREKEGGEEGPRQGPGLAGSGGESRDQPASPACLPHSALACAALRAALLPTRRARRRNGRPCTLLHTMTGSRRWRRWWAWARPSMREK